MSTHMSLRMLAVHKGAEDELGCSNFEVFAHGTTAAVAQQIVDTQGGCLSARGGRWLGRFFTVANIEAAKVFAIRTSDNARHGNPTVVAMALPAAVVEGLKGKRLLSSPPIPNPPAGVSLTTPQFVFEPGALDELKRSGYFFLAE